MLLTDHETGTDYYEVPQISRNADIETIHRVYRMMAARFHPDNPRTGIGAFLRLKHAYRYCRTLERRERYDDRHQLKQRR